MSRWRTGAPALAAALALMACSPALDWREIRLAAPGWSLWFPCKPKLQDRPIELAGQAWSARLMACDAAGLTFAALVLEPQPVGPNDPANPAQAPSGPTNPDRADLALRALVEGAPNRWGPIDGKLEPPPDTKWPDGVSAQWTRHRRLGAEGQAVVAQVLSFSQAGRVVQISLQGTAPDAPAAEPFFGQLRYAP